MSNEADGADLFRAATIMHGFGGRWGIAGGWAIEQLWLFWVAPIVGALLAGLAYPALARESAPKAQAKAAAR